MVVRTVDYGDGRALETGQVRQFRPRGKPGCYDKIVDPVHAGGSLEFPQVPSPFGGHGLLSPPGVDAEVRGVDLEVFHELIPSYITGIVGRIRQPRKRGVSLVRVEAEGSVVVVPRLRERSRPLQQFEGQASCPQAAGNGESSRTCAHNERVQPLIHGIQSSTSQALQATVCDTVCVCLSKRFTQRVGRRRRLPAATEGLADVPHDGSVQRSILPHALSLRRSGTDWWNRKKPSGSYLRLRCTNLSRFVP